MNWKAAVQTVFTLLLLALFVLTGLVASHWLGVLWGRVIPAITIGILAGLLALTVIFIYDFFDKDVY